MVVHGINEAANVVLTAKGKIQRLQSSGSQMSSQASVNLRRHPPRAAALVEETPDPLSLPHSLHSHAIHKHMPVKYRNL